MAVRECRHEQVRELGAHYVLEPPEGRRAVALWLGEGQAVCEEEFRPSSPGPGRGSVLHTALSIDGPPTPA